MKETCRVAGGVDPGKTRPATAPARFRNASARRRAARRAPPRPPRQLQARYVGTDDCLCVHVRGCMCKCVPGGGAVRGKGRDPPGGGREHKFKLASIDLNQETGSGQGILGIVVPGAFLRPSRGLFPHASAAPGPSLAREEEWGTELPELSRALIRFAFVWRHEIGLMLCSGGLHNNCEKSASDPPPVLLFAFVPPPSTRLLILRQLRASHLNCLTQALMSSDHTGKLAPPGKGRPGNQTLRAAQRSKNLWKLDRAIGVRSQGHRFPIGRGNRCHSANVKGTTDAALLLGQVTTRWS